MTEYTFSDRISTLKPSAIREIFKVLTDPNVISFAGGNPAPETFPVADMAETAADIFAEEPALALQYGITEGYAPLRELTAARLRNKYGIGGDADDLLIVTGGQQGIEHTAKVLCNEGDTVICERPSFIGALNAFRSYNINLVGVPVDADGMDPDALEHALKSNKNTRFIYTIPTFQNPAGVTLTLERRRRVLELADKYNVMILEDSPYFEHRYSGEYVPPLKALDESGRVIYIGSYSKTITPGIRLGFVCAPKPVCAKITVAKQISDVHTNQFFQVLVARFLERYDLDAHIERARLLYRGKRDRMLAALGRHLSDRATWNVPDGGIFIWAALTGIEDSGPFCKYLSARRVAVVPGSAFLTDENEKSNGFRLNFSFPSLERIDEGVEIMGRCLEGFK